MSELQEIVDSIHHAYNSGNKQMQDIAIQDLKDISSSYSKLVIEFRFVALNGDRVYAYGQLPYNPKVIEVNGVRNPVQIALYQKILENNPPDIFKIFKHLNDMSPEEYAWCTGDE